MCVEEFSDLLVAIEALEIKEDIEIMKEKAQRWANRLIEIKEMRWEEEE